VRQRGTVQTSIVNIPVDAVELPAQLRVPDDVAAAVVCVQSRGGTPRRPRRNDVIGALHEARVATLVCDLLTEREAAQRADTLAVGRLAGRLADLTAWLRHHEGTEGLQIGYCAAGIAAAAALIAAAEDPTVRAVVSCSGRPDWAASALPRVRAPTLLIVGDEDIPLLRVNEQAYAQLRCEKDLRVVRGAGLLFDEPGTGREVARWATSWCVRYVMKP
jgi:putative phosphoribosyl transferase